MLDPKAPLNAPIAAVAILPGAAEGESSGMLRMRADRAVIFFLRYSKVERSMAL